MPNDTKLNQLVEEFGFNKTELESYKKIVDKLNSEIKSLMSDSSLNDFESEHYVAKYTESRRESFDDDKLLEVLKSSESASKVIKTKEYVDMDELEKAIYSGEIPQEILVQLNSCKSVKIVPTLKVTRKKVKK